MIALKPDPVRSPVRVTRLGLADFRSYASLNLRISGEHVCLFGANGAGKTNLLEALSMLSPGRGLRGAAPADIVRRGPEGSAARWSLSADLSDGEHERRVTLALELDDSGRSRRIARIDGAPATGPDIGALVSVIWLTPSMDRVFAGPAGERRKFLDRLVLAHAPSHGVLAAAYERAMRERNALLERGRADPVWLDALEARMAEAGAGIAINRTLAVARMQAAIDARAEGYFPKADLALEGPLEALAAQTPDAPAIAAACAAQLKAGRPRDAAAGRTLFGVHRTELVVVHRPKSTPAALCSTGEQKALLIGLILANAQALFARDFAPDPLLLLDEAAAHLDSDRRAALYDELSRLGSQSWLTGTDRSLFDAFANRAELFVVDGGEVRRA